MEESAKARQAYADYVALGADRSLTALLELYRTRTESAPTKHLTTLKQWSTKYGWQARIATLADEQAANAEREILESGLALVTQRVALLKEFGESLTVELRNGALYTHEPRGVGSGEDFTIEYVKKPSAVFLRELRGLLDDIAKETGGRVTKQEVSGPNGGPFVVERVTFAGDDED